MKLQRWHWVMMVLSDGCTVVMAPSDDGDVAKKALDRIRRGQVYLSLNYLFQIGLYPLRGARSWSC